MNRLPTAKRAHMLGLLVEGMSMRAVSRLTGVSINTVVKLLADAGEACATYHDEHVRGVDAVRIQVDEIWAFVYAKEKNVPRAKDAPDWAGNAWTWTALEADTKLLVSWMVGHRTAECALALLDDVRERTVNRFQLTTDGLKAYLSATEAAFGGDIDYAMLVKLYGPGGGQSETRYSPAECIGTRRLVVQGNPDPGHISTSYVERHNLTMRMSMRRFTRLTNGFSKRVEKHAAMVALYTLHYNYCRVHKSLRITPAMAAGLDTTVRDLEWIVGIIDAATPAPQRPSRYKKRGDISN